MLNDVDLWENMWEMAYVFDKRFKYVENDV